jgi:hypothetical protein
MSPPVTIQIGTSALSRPRVRRVTPKIPEPVKAPVKPMMAKKKNNMGVILILLLVIGLAVGGYFLYQQMNKGTSKYEAPYRPVPPIIVPVKSRYDNPSPTSEERAKPGAVPKSEYAKFSIRPAQGYTSYYHI